MNKDETLANLIKSYIKTRRDSKEEALYKDKPKKNKQGTITNGAFNTRLLSVVKRLIDDKKAISQVEKTKKTKEQTSLAFQQQKFQQLLDLLPDNTFDNELSEIKNELHQYRLELDEEFEPVTWMNQWTPKAVDISFATHVAKLTHSSSKGSSILDSSQEVDEHFLTTSSLKMSSIDTASSNAASLPIAEILKLSVDDVSVIDCLKAGDVELFSYLTNDDGLVQTWYENLKQAYDSEHKQSYFLNKQIYFPIEDDQYHLLLPLTSSSLVHAVHLEHQKYFHNDAVAVREQRKKGLYSNQEIRIYPNKAYLHITGSNHSNASSLNGQRGGRMALFSANPPHWRSNHQTVENKTTIFDSDLSYQLRAEITELRKYLIVIKNEKLSINKPDRNAAVIKKLRAISEAFFDQIELIKQNQTEANWTTHSDLTIEQQLLFEPARQDERAVEAKLKKERLKKLSDSFSRWLNKQLKNKQLKLTSIQARLWSDQFYIVLKEYIAIEEAAV